MALSVRMGVLVREMRIIIMIMTLMMMMMPSSPLPQDAIRSVQRPSNAPSVGALLLLLLRAVPCWRRGCTANRAMTGRVGRSLLRWHLLCVRPLACQQRCRTCMHPLWWHAPQCVARGRISRRHAWRYAIGILLVAIGHAVALRVGGASQKRLPQRHGHDRARIGMWQQR